jgi:hypothetical protein
MTTPEYVWLVDERTYAVMIRRGAHVSLVHFSRGGIDYEIMMENDDFVDDKGTDDDPAED